MNDHHFDIHGFWFLIRYFAVPAVLMVAIFKIFSPDPMVGTVPFVETREQVSAQAVESVLEEIEPKERILRQIEELAVHKQIPEKGRLIAVDLGAMQLFLYEDGEIKKTVPVISKGKPGSYWETPSGLYSIRTKENVHFSSIGEVYMPYSMQFYGNFFIHGWPYYPGGKEVAEGYSGGCVRLKTEDAKEVFAFADISTPVFIYEEEESKSGLSRIRLREVDPPSVSAESFLVADLDTGHVFLEKNAAEKRPVASLTKLVTAIVANETVSFDRQIAVVENPDFQSEGDRGRFRAGESFVVLDILHPLLMESNNNVADSIAKYYGSKIFITRMNEKASAIGMTNTAFADASGISAGNVSTAEDIFKLASYLRDKTSFILNISKRKEKTITASSGSAYTIRNFNHFSGDDSFIGGKTGFTRAANETMLSVFKMPNEPDRAFAVIVLGSNSRDKDTSALRSWLERSIVPKGDEIKLGFVGDIMLDRGVEASIIKNGKGSFSYIFSEISSYLNTFDFLFGNLEGPISDKGLNQGSIYSFRMDPNAAGALSGAGFDAVSLANNHAGDWGGAALKDTLIRLERAGIKAVGAGSNYKEAYESKNFEIKGTKIAILAYTEFNSHMKAKEDTPGIAIAEDVAVKAAVERASLNSDIVIVTFHFGTEYQTEPNDYQKRISRLAIDSGADLIVGHHPHVVQPIEKYKHGYIAYSLGNFVFDQSFSDETMTGMVLDVSAKGGIITDVSGRKVLINGKFQPSVVF